MYENNPDVAYEAHQDVKTESLLAQGADILTKADLVSYLKAWVERKDLECPGFICTVDELIQELEGESDMDDES